MNNCDRFNTGFFIGATSLMLLLLIAKSCSESQSRNPTRLNDKNSRPCYAARALAFNDNDYQSQDYDLASDDYFLEYQDAVELESSNSNQVGRDFQDGPIFLESQYVDEHDIFEQQELDRARRHYELIHGVENDYQ